MSRVLGVWSTEGWLDLDPTHISSMARFGTSVAIDRDTGTFAIVGAPGVGVASFFKRTVSGGIGTWSRTQTVLVGTLPLSDAGCIVACCFVLLAIPRVSGHMCAQQLQV